MRLFKRSSWQIILTDIVVWVLAMVIYVILRFYRYDDQVAILIDGIEISFEETLRFGFQAGLILGVIYGIMDVFLDQHWLRKRSYRTVLLVKGFIHLVVIVFLSIVIRVEAFDRMDIEITLSGLGGSLANTNLLIILFYTTLVNFIINFTRQITLKFGPGNLTKFLTGRFHHPKEETRIFMFLDMKDSTTHAERLGHVQFAELIQDCFSDLTVIERRHAEVYQYVGDEAIVYWEVDRGLKHLNCIRAYFDFKQQLVDRSEYYRKKYDIDPVFTAGANIGQVTVTEIGDIKRDLAFLGDTMNTAARIQGLCGRYDADLLISDSLREHLNGALDLELKQLDHLALRGKHQSIGIYSVELKTITQL